MKRLSFILTLFAAVFGSNASDFPRVLLAGDYPDPSVLRDGNDYYMTHSPFYYTPGFLIWHSRDLLNWEPVCRALPEYEGSAMAPDLVKHDGKYYIYFPSAGTNWVTWADSITGPWSAPVDLKVPGIDPGHIAGKDGKRYLYVNEGEIIALAPDGLSTVGEKRKVYDGWQYPATWDTEGMYLESPKLIYHQGYYYLTSAEGGTAGPATSHMAVSARSRNVDGPWEDSPYNPLVHTYSADENWWSKGHGTIVDDTDGNWWIIYHAYLNSYHTLGRSTLIEPLEYTADGWFKAIPSQDFPEVASPTENGMELSDTFDSLQLGLQWTFWGENAQDKIECKGNKLNVKGKGLTPSTSRLLLTTPQHKSYIAETEVNLSENATAGLLLYYNDKAFAGVTSDGRQINIWTSANKCKSIKSDLGRQFNIRLKNIENKLTAEVSNDGVHWMTVAENIDVAGFHHNNFKGFYALRPALSVSGEGSAEFNRFIYRPASSDINN